MKTESEYQVNSKGFNEVADTIEKLNKIQFEYNTLSEELSIKVNAVIDTFVSQNSNTIAALTESINDQRNKVFNLVLEQVEVMREDNYKAPPYTGLIFQWQNLAGEIEPYISTPAFNNIKPILLDGVEIPSQSESEI